MDVDTQTDMDARWSRFRCMNCKGVAAENEMAELALCINPQDPVAVKRGICDKCMPRIGLLGERMRTPFGESIGTLK